MNTLRWVLSVVSAVLLVAGYIANEVAWFQGMPAVYVAKVDQPPVRALAALLLLAALILCPVPDREGASG